MEAVREFADGRVFTGEQAVNLGLIDRLGTEEEARRWVAELAELDPEKAECRTIEEPKPLWSRILGGENRVKSGLPAAIDWLEFETSTNGLPLWLYRP